jgi:hypothetical protein
MYSGPLSDTVRHGAGASYAFRNRYFTYEGTYEGGVRQGWGRLLLGVDPRRPDAVVTGQFERGEIEGFGKKQWADGSLYEGNFLRGEPHGQGRLELVSAGSLYEGEFVLNRYEGEGRISFADEQGRRCTYEGEFRAHRRCGRGRLMWAPPAQPPSPDAAGSGGGDSGSGGGGGGGGGGGNGRARSSGAPARDSPSPSGSDNDEASPRLPASRPASASAPAVRQAPPSGALAAYELLAEQLDGEFRDNAANGRGVCRYRDGGVYDGEFADGRRHGVGTLSYPASSAPAGEGGSGRRGSASGGPVDALVFTGLWERGALAVGVATRAEVSLPSVPEPKLKTWPPPTPEEEAAAAKPKKKTSQSAPGAAKKGLAALVEITPLYRKGAVPVPLGGVLPNVLVSVLRIDPSVAQPDPAAVAAEEAALAAAAAAADKPVKLTARDVLGGVSARAIKDANAPPWRVPPKPYEVPLAEESRRHFELTLYEHETSSSTSFCEFAEREREHKKRLADLALADAAKAGVPAMPAGAPAGSAPAGAAAGDPKAARSASAGPTPSAAPKASAAAAAAAKPAAAATPAKGGNAKASEAAAVADSAPREGSAGSARSPRSKTIFQLMTEKAREIAGQSPPTPRVTNQPRTGVRGAVLASVWSERGVATFEGVALPGDVRTGQYSIAIRDVTARLAVRERMPTVYVPVDVLPPECW